MPIPAILAALLAATLLPSAPRAQDCFTNLVPNGGFESNRNDPWTVAPAVAATPYFGIAAVDGLLRSQCVELRAGGSAPFTLSQATAFRLTGGAAYEIALDVHGGSCCVDLSVGLTTSGVRHPVVAERIGVDRHRVSARFTAPSTGDYSLDIGFTPTAATYLRVDNVVVRPSALQFQFVGPRIAGTSVRYRVDGEPGAPFIVFFGVDGIFDRPWPVLPCAGGLWLLVPLEVLVVGNLDAQGSFAASIAVPEVARGGVSFWQPLSLAAPCAFGCPQVYSFL